MTTFELISYIRKQIQNNISKDLIISKLVGVGWRKEDIDEGFSSVELEVKSEISSPEIKLPNDKEIASSAIHRGGGEEIVDKYHEPLVGDNIFEIKRGSHKIETPIIETPKVWIPIRMPVKEIAPSAIHRGDGKEDNLDVKTEVTQIEIQNLELQTGKPARNAESIASLGGENKLGQPKEIRNFDKNKTLDIINPKYFNKKEEFIPTLMPKAVVNSFGSINKDNLTKPNSPIVSPESSKNSFSNNLPKMAMLSSYPNDLLSVNKIKEKNIKQEDHRIAKWLILALIIFIIASSIWAFSSGYINIKNLNFPFIKKDPKVLLLSNSKTLSSLKSYKSETNIEISSPSFANITYGLVSGEAVTSPDKDSFSINILGLINQNEKGLLSDNFIKIKSSILQDYITTDIKNNGTDLFVSVPDLSGIIKDNAPEPSIVKINEQQFDLIPSLFSPYIESQLKKINLYKILSIGMSSFINNETLNTYDEFINNVEIVEKGQDNIRGVDTYRYSINSDRQLSKNLLSKISDNFVSNLSTDDKDKLTQILGSTTVDSFDVWVGKGDNNIYQYNVILDIPLSKIIGFEDKSIGDNKININWKTTYYDFNVPNNVVIPDTSIPATDFMNSIKELKIKNDVYSLKQLAINLFDIEKTYGKKSNANGSCINPSSGSLFSPTGHNKSATTAVSSISLLLNKILGTTNDAGFCYSTLKAWSFTVPISPIYDISLLPAGGYTSFFCVDSTGVKQDLTTVPTGVTCTPKVETPKIETNKPL